MSLLQDLTVQQIVTRIFAMLIYAAVQGALHRRIDQHGEDAGDDLLDGQVLKKRHAPRLNPAGASGNVPSPE